MAEKRMLIVPAELAQKIDDNRGDLSQNDFIDYLIDSQLKQEQPKEKHPSPQYATREEIQTLEEDVKKLLKTFIDFFLNYGLEMGKQPREGEFEELTDKLKGLDKDTDQGAQKGRATIKWK